MFFYQMAIFITVVLHCGFLIKWILGEYGRKMEFQCSLPVSARRRTEAELLELAGLLAIPAAVGLMDGAVCRHALNRNLDLGDFSVEEALIKNNRMWYLIDGKYRKQVVGS